MIIAERLLNKILTDYPDNTFEISPTYNQLGEIYKIRGDYENALKYFQKSLDFENGNSNVITTSYLDFAETVIRAEKTELYDNVYSLLIDKENEVGLKFPAQNYIMYSVLSVICEYYGNSEQSKIYAELAEQNATTQINTLWNPRKKKIGVVKERLKWLDKLVRKN